MKIEANIRKIFKDYDTLNENDIKILEEIESLDKETNDILASIKELV